MQNLHFSLCLKSVLRNDVGYVAREDAATTATVLSKIVRET